MYGKPPHMPHVKNVPPEVSWRQTNKLNKQTNKQIDKQTNKQTNKQRLKTNLLAEVKTLSLIG